jgi:radical SAM enzyme (TIGR01210 family)
VSQSADSPLAVEWAPGRVNGRQGHRLMVILAAPGCAWARESGGCSNCSFATALAINRPVTTGEYLAQLAQALTQIPADHGPIELDLFVSGSFLNPEEVPADAQQALVEQAARHPRIDSILVETRPEYATDAALEVLVTAAGEVPVEVGIGLESADPEILGQRINKGFTWPDFEQSARRIAAAGAKLLTYVLLKPIDTSEAEAIADAVTTAEKVFGLAGTLDLPVRIALEPCFVAPGTPLAEAFARGDYRPPWLWSVIEVVRQVAGSGQILVGLSDEGLQPAQVAHSCQRCSSRVRQALADFNISQDPAPLARLDCSCRQEWYRLVVR